MAPPSHPTLDRFLHTLVERGGSDLHLQAGSPPRVRVNGVLSVIEGEPSLSPEDTQEIAETIMRPSVAEQFDTKGEGDFAHSIEGLGRFRVNVFRQRGSVALIMRMVRANAQSFDQLGLPEVVARLAGEHRGLILVTGPTGSGKTTTLAAMIDHINQNRECHIITIEDPIEVLHPAGKAEVNQREIGFDTKDFPAAMRAAMRQDPDVILVGEMRDQETVAAALSAAETGHLVLSTLHTIDAPETINRIVDFFPPHQQNQIRVALAGSLKGTICQRLVRTVDGEGRVAAFEVMVSNGRIQECILDPQRTSEIHEMIAEGSYYGMVTFDQSLARLFEQGRIALREALAAASQPHDLQVMLQNKGLISTGTRAG
jgi:twitching motility protein PilT